MVVINDLLLVVLLLPFLGALLHAILPDHARLQGRVHFVSTWIIGIITTWVGLIGLTQSEGLNLEWPAIALRGMGIDLQPRLWLNGGNAPFILLLGLAPLVVFTLLRDKKNRFGRSYYLSAQLLLGSLAGVFLSDTLLLFYLFWEFALVAVYFWIGMHGRPSFYSGSVYNTLMRFVLMTLAGSLPMLASIAAILAHDGRDPGLHDLSVVVADLSPSVQKWVFLGFLLGIAVKLPMLGLHGWLRDTYNVASPACRALLSAVMSKMGAFGLIFILAQGFPEQCIAFAPWLQLWAVMAVVYGALLCMAQERLVDILIYSSLSHLGLIALGVFAGTTAGTVASTGYTGAMLQVFNHGLIMAMLFSLDARILANEESPDMGLISGLRAPLRKLTAIFLVGIFASASLPGLSNFTGEILVYFTAYKNSAWLTFLAATGALIGAAALMRAFHKIFFGTLPASTRAGYEVGGDLTPMETTLSLMLMAVWLVLGLYPMLMVSPVEKALISMGLSGFGGMP